MYHTKNIQSLQIRTRFEKVLNSYDDVSRTERINSPKRQSKINVSHLFKIRKNKFSMI